MPKIIFIDAPTSPQERIGALSDIIDLSRDRPHIGILTLAAVAKQQGWKPKVIDPYPFQYTDEQILDQVKEFNPDLIGISSHTLGIANGNRLAGCIKKSLPKVPILIGGPHITSASETTLAEFGNFDIGVVGEAEETLKELLSCFQHNQFELQFLKHVQSISFRNTDGSIQLTSRRSNITQLDDIPQPAWDLLPQYPFLYSPSLSSGAGTKPTGSLFTTRGCPWRCKFCDRGVFGDSLRKFSANYVMEQIRILYHQYDVREIMFADDTFLADKKRAYELAELLIKENLDLRWECMARVVDADANLYPLLKKSGCFEISYGIESADDRISQLIFKPINQKNILESIKITKEAGIRARGYFIYGLPGETKETLDTTHKFILSSDLDDVSVFACTPYPGSALYDMASDYGHFEKNYSKMNNVEVVFVPHGLTKEYIEEMKLKTMKKFYVNPRYIYQWTKRTLKEDGLRGVARRGKDYSRFFKRTLVEMISGLGRAA